MSVHPEQMAPRNVKQANNNSNTHALGTTAHVNTHMSPYSCENPRGVNAAIGWTFLPHAHSPASFAYRNVLTAPTYQCEHTCDDVSMQHVSACDFCVDSWTPSDTRRKKTNMSKSMNEPEQDFRSFTSQISMLAATLNSKIRVQVAVVRLAVRVRGSLRIRGHDLQP